jgi:hypothetical protein
LSIRARHIEKLRVFYAQNRDWCNAHNNPCDPEWFDSDVKGEIAVSAATDSLAFIARLDNTNYWSDAQRTRLEAFREIRNYLRDHPAAAPDQLLTYFFSDLGRVGRLNMKKAVLNLFSADHELQDFLAEAFAARESAPESLHDFAARFGPQWETDSLRKKFLQATESEPEFTDVLYIYRNLAHPEVAEYRELLLADWNTRFGGGPPANALSAEFLRQIFDY